MEVRSSHVKRLQRKQCWLLAVPVILPDIPVIPAWDRTGEWRSLIEHASLSINHVKKKVPRCQAKLTCSSPLQSSRPCYLRCQTSWSRDGPSLLFLEQHILKIKQNKNKNQELSFILFWFLRMVV